MTGTAKAWAQVLATVLAGLIPFIADNQLNGVEVVNTLLLSFSAIAVAIVPNLTDGVAKYAKGIVAVGTAVLTLLVSLFADGSYALNSSEWIQLGIAAFGALGVIGLPAPQHATSPRAV